MKNLFSLLFILCFLISCGKNPESKIVKDVSITTSFENENVFLNIGIAVDLGGPNMTSITLPIFNPTDPDSPMYGEISFRPTIDSGVSEIGIKFNMSFSSEVLGGFASLPNGKELPIKGLDQSNIIELAIEKIHSKIYLSITKQSSIFGFAVAISEFDVLDGHIPGANIFLGFDIKGVLGMVGLFTGDQPWESGLAFFLDISKYFTGDILEKLARKDTITHEDFTVMKQQLEVQKQSEASLAQKAKFQNKNISLSAISTLQKTMKKLDGKILNFVANE